MPGSNDRVTRNCSNRNSTPILRRPLRNRIYQRVTASIKRAITEGTLTPGARLPSEREMARRHKVSRVSVREAYRSLEELGVIVVRRGARGGAVIAEPGHGAVQESLSLMLRLGRTSDDELSEAWMIEPLIARLAARHARAEDVARLRAVLESEEAAVARHGHARPHRLRFQRALATCAHNLPLLALMNSLADLTLEALPAGASWGIPEEAILRSHRSIFEAIERGDEAAAHQLMRQHVASIQSAMAGILADRRAAGVDAGEQPRTPARHAAA
jgi:GntR family transcriptional repressor for pyruvate dehydrogenase complex